MKYPGVSLAADQDGKRGSWPGALMLRPFRAWVLGEAAGWQALADRKRGYGPAA